MSQSSLNEHQQSNHSLRVKFEQIQASQFYHQEKQLIKKPSINMKLQRSNEYGQSSSQQASNQEEPQLSSMVNFPSNQTKRKSTSQQQRKSQISNFIIKTYRILQDKANSQIIHWTDEGNAFIVKNKDRFQNQILPKYFKHKKFSSFVRQLNMYDFHKIRKEKDIPIFKHKYFKQGCVDLLAKIKRKSGDEVMGQGDDEDGTGNVMFCDTKNYIPSLFELTQKPIPSAMSFKSRSMLPFPSMLASQPSLGMLPGIINGQASQIDLLIQQNAQLNSSIAQLSRQQVKLQMEKERRKEKITKILNVLLNCDLNQMISNNQGLGQYGELRFEGFNLRDLQSHFSSQQDPYSFCQYLNCMTTIYKDIRQNVMKMNSLQSGQKGQDNNQDRQ